ncbi:MAG: slipin family protein [Candidatus Lambdaproteobacteria bacterium]|nr:slipin family protein [Candidatus Lambdaproteobacteria bacterium]
MLTTIAVVIIILLGLLYAAIRILPEYQRAVIFRLGRAVGVKGPGLILLIPLIDKMRRVDLRTVVLDIPPQDVITRDNVSIKVNAVNYFRVVDPMKAIIEVEDYLFATSQLAQTTLRAVVGQVELDEVLSEREAINHRLQEILDTHTDPWGIKVSQVEVKDVDLPQEMRRSIAKQAEAERERRAKIIMAQAEETAAEFLVKAARQMADNPVAVQLRFMQTILEMEGPGHTVAVLPIPVDMISHLMQLKKNTGQ